MADFQSQILYFWKKILRQDKNYGGSGRGQVAKTAATFSDSSDHLCPLSARQRM